MRANLLGSFLSDPINDLDFFDNCGGDNAWAFKRLVFGLCFFHAVIQARDPVQHTLCNTPCAARALALRTRRQVALCASGGVEVQGD